MGANRMNSIISFVYVPPFRVSIFGWTCAIQSQSQATWRCTVLAECGQSFAEQRADAKYRHRWKLKTDGLGLCSNGVWLWSKVSKYMCYLKTSIKLTLGLGSCKSSQKGKQAKLSMHAIPYEGLERKLWSKEANWTNEPLEQRRTKTDNSTFPSRKIDTKQSIPRWNKRIKTLSALNLFI